MDTTRNALVGRKAILRTSFSEGCNVYGMLYRADGDEYSSYDYCFVVDQHQKIPDNVASRLHDASRRFRTNIAYFVRFGEFELAEYSDDVDNWV